MSFILSIYLTHIRSIEESEFAGESLVCKLIDFEAQEGQEAEEQEQRIAGRDGHDRRMYSFPEDGNNFEFLISSFATLTLMVYDDGGEHGYGSLQLDAEQEGDVNDKPVVCDISFDGEVVAQALLTISLVSIGDGTSGSARTADQVGNNDDAFAGTGTVTADGGSTDDILIISPDNGYYGDRDNNNNGSNDDNDDNNEESGVFKHLEGSLADNNNNNDSLLIEKSGVIESPSSSSSPNPRGDTTRSSNSNDTDAVAKASAGKLPAIVDVDLSGSKSSPSASRGYVAVPVTSPQASPSPKDSVSAEGSKSSSPVKQQTIIKTPDQIISKSTSHTPNSHKSNNINSNNNNNATSPPKAVPVPPLRKKNPIKGTSSAAADNFGAVETPSLTSLQRIFSTDFDPVTSSVNSFCRAVDGVNDYADEVIESNKFLLMQADAANASSNSNKAWDRVLEANNSDLSKITEALNKKSFYIHRVVISGDESGSFEAPPSLSVKASLVPLPGKVVTVKSSACQARVVSASDSTGSNNGAMKPDRTDFDYDFPESKKKLSFSVSIADVRSKLYKALSPCLYLQVIIDDGIDNNKNVVFSAAFYIASILELESLSNKIIKIPMSSDSSPLIVSIQISAIRNDSPSVSSSNVDVANSLTATAPSASFSSMERLSYGSVSPGSYVGLLSMRLNIMGLQGSKLPFSLDDLNDWKNPSSNKSDKMLWLAVKVSLLSSNASKTIDLSPEEISYIKANPNQAGSSALLLFNRKISFDCQTEFMHLDVLEFSFVLVTASGSKKHLGIAQIPVKSIASASANPLVVTRRGESKIGSTFSSRDPLCVPFISFETINGKRQAVVCDWRLVAAFEGVAVSSGIPSKKIGENSIKASHNQEEDGEEGKDAAVAGNIDDTSRLPKSFVPPETIHGTMRVCVQGFICTGPSGEDFKPDCFAFDFGVFPLIPGSTSASVSTTLDSFEVDKNKAYVKTFWKENNIMTVPIVYSCQQLKVSHLKISLKTTGATSFKPATSIGSTILDVASIVIHQPNSIVHQLMPVRSNNVTKGWLMVSFQFHARGYLIPLAKDSELRLAAVEQWGLTCSNAASIPLAVIDSHSGGRSNNNSNSNSNNKVGASGATLHIAMAPTLGALSIDYFDIERRAGKDIYIVFQLINKRSPSGHGKDSSSGNSSGFLQKAIRLLHNSESNSYKWECHDAILSIEQHSFWDVALSVSLLKTRADVEPELLTYPVYDSSLTTLIGESVISLPSIHLEKGIPINVNIPLRSASGARIAVISLSAQQTSLGAASDTSVMIIRSPRPSSPMKMRAAVVPVSAKSGNARLLTVSFVDGARTDLKSTDLHPFFECIAIPPSSESLKAKFSAFSGCFKSFSDLSNGPSSASMELMLEDDDVPETTRDEMSTDKWSLLILCRDSLQHRGPKIAWTRVTLPWSLLSRGRDLEQWVTLISSSSSSSSSSSNVASLIPSETGSVGAQSVARIRIVVKCAASSAHGTNSNPSSTGAFDTAVKGVGFVLVSVNSLYENRAGQEKDASKVSVATITSYTVPAVSDNQQDNSINLENQRFCEVALTPYVTLKHAPGSSGTAYAQEFYSGVVAVPGGNCEIQTQLATANSIVPYSAGFSVKRSLPRLAALSSSDNKASGSSAFVNIETTSIKLSLSSSASGVTMSSNGSKWADGGGTLSKVQKRTPIVDLTAVFIPYVRGNLYISISSTKLTPFLESRLAIKPESSRRLFFRILVNEHTFSYSSVFDAPLSISKTSSSSSTKTSSQDVIILPIDTSKIFQNANSQYRNFNVEVTLLGYEPPFHASASPSASSSQSTLQDHVKGVGTFDISPLFHLACRSASSSSLNSSSHDIGVTPKTNVDVGLIDTESKLLLGKVTCSVQLELIDVDDSGVRSLTKSSNSSSSTSDEATTRLELGLKQAFLLADSDKSGSVSSKELLEVIKRGTPAPAKYDGKIAFNGKEANKAIVKKKTDAVVGMEDPIALLTGLIGQFTIRGEELSITNETALESMVKEIFSKLDVDGDGMISWWEWKTVLFLSLSSGGALKDVANDSLVMGSLAAKNAISTSKKELLYPASGPTIESAYRVEELTTMSVRAQPTALADQVGGVAGNSNSGSGYPSTPSSESAVAKLELAIHNLRAHNATLYQQLATITAKSSGGEDIEDSAHKRALERVTLKLQQSEQVIMSYEKILKNRSAGFVEVAGAHDDQGSGSTLSVAGSAARVGKLNKVIRNPITSHAELDGKVAEVEEKHRRKLSGMLKEKQRKLVALQKIRGGLRRWVARCRERKLKKLKDAREKEVALLKLQGGARGFVERKKLKKLEKKAIVIQSHIRSLLAKKVRERLLLEKTLAMMSSQYRASSIISRVVKRFYLAFTERKNKAAEAIQNAFKANRAKKDGKEQLKRLKVQRAEEAEASVKIQKLAKIKKQKDIKKKEIEVKKSSEGAKKVQSLFRGHQDRKKVSSLKFVEEKEKLICRAKELIENSGNISRNHRFGHDIRPRLEDCMSYWVVMDPERRLKNGGGVAVASNVIELAGNVGQVTAIDAELRLLTVMKLNPDATSMSDLKISFVLPFDHPALVWLATSSLCDLEPLGYSSSSSTSNRAANITANKSSYNSGGDEEEKENAADTLTFKSPSTDAFVSNRTIFMEGDLVMVNFRNAGEWYGGVIVKTTNIGLNGQGSMAADWVYDVRFDVDNSQSSYVEHDLIRLRSDNENNTISAVNNNDNVNNLNGSSSKVEINLSREGSSQEIFKSASRIEINLSRDASNRDLSDAPVSITISRSNSLPDLTAVTAPNDTMAATSTMKEGKVDNDENFEGESRNVILESTGDALGDLTRRPEVRINQMVHYSPDGQEINQKTGRVVNIYQSGNLIDVEFLRQHAGQIQHKIMLDHPYLTLLDEMYVLPPSSSTLAFDSFRNTGESDSSLVLFGTMQQQHHQHHHHQNSPPLMELDMTTTTTTAAGGNNFSLESSMVSSSISNRPPITESKGYRIELRDDEDPDEAFSGIVVGFNEANETINVKFENAEEDSDDIYHTIPYASTAVFWVCQEVFPSQPSSPKKKKALSASGALSAPLISDTIGCTIEIRDVGKAIVCDKDDKKKILRVLFPNETETEAFPYKSKDITWVHSPKYIPDSNIGVPAIVRWEDISKESVTLRPPLHETIGHYFEATEVDGIIRGKIIGIKCKSSGKLMKKLFVNFFDDKNILEWDNVQEYEYDYTKDPSSFKWFRKVN